MAGNVPSASDKSHRARWTRDVYIDGKGRKITARRNTRGCGRVEWERERGFNLAALIGSRPARSNTQEAQRSTRATAVISVATSTSRLQGPANSHAVKTVQQIQADVAIVRHSLGPVMSSRGWVRC